MAPTNAFGTFPHASNRAVLFDRFDHVLRTGGRKPAIATNERADRTLIKSHYRNEYTSCESFQSHGPVSLSFQTVNGW